MMQAIRCTFGHHDWGPIIGAIDEALHECTRCGRMKPIKIASLREAPRAGFRTNIDRRGSHGARLYHAEFEPPREP
jgi:hypothetical protein